MASACTASSRVAYCFRFSLSASNVTLGRMPAYAIGALSRNSATPPIKSPSPDTQGDMRPMVYVAPPATIAFSQASESSRPSIVPTWPSSNSGTLLAGDGTAAMLLSSGAALNVMPPLLVASGGAPGVGAGRGVGVGVGGVATPLPGVMVITTTTPKLIASSRAAPMPTTPVRFIGHLPLSALPSDSGDEPADPESEPGSL